MKTQIKEFNIKLTEDVVNSMIKNEIIKRHIIGMIMVIRLGN